jgi:hypothetical protein
MLLNGGQAGESSGEKKLIFDGQRSHPTKIIKKVFDLLTFGIFARECFNTLALCKKQ